MVLCAAAALVLAGCIATAQATVTNIFKNLNKVIPAGQATEVSDTHNLVFASSGLTYVSDVNGRQLPATWAQEGRAVDLGDILNTDAQTTLLGSFTATNPNGAWPLFLSDLDFGEQGTLVKWGAIVTAIPEPSSWTFVGLGGAVLAIHFMRRRVSG